MLACLHRLHPIKTTDLWVPKIYVDSWRSLANLDLSARRSVKILNKYMLLKSHEPFYAMCIKSGIVIPEESIRGCALKLGSFKFRLSDTKKSIIHYRFDNCMRSHSRVALEVELSIFHKDFHMLFMS